jgi:hypothetical protein
MYRIRYYNSDGFSMKPSERIVEIYYKMREAYNNVDSSILATPDAAIIEYLDEETEKPKYVCPNCHRIVDELIEYHAPFYLNGERISFDGKNLAVEATSMLHCKCCCPTNQPEE